MFKKLPFLFFLIISTSVAAAQSFQHPGLLQSAADIARIKQAVATKKAPIYAGYLVFESNIRSQSTYQMQGPMAMVGRNPTVGQSTYDGDAGAAYQNAVMWAITGKQEFADKAIRIVNAWSSTLKYITGRDAVLMAGLGPFKMVNAAEILRYTQSGWSPEDIKQTEAHFKNVIYPVIENYAPFANGNWDSAAMKTAMAIGVFCNDRKIFEKALRYYQDGAGDGSIFHYIINETGQCQESGRDQAHTQLGIAHLADCSEIAWHQGLDLYGYSNDLLLKGFEYTAKYNLGFEVPYTGQLDQTGKYYNKKISEETRGRFRTIYEEVYNHYVNRVGLSAPFTQQVVEKTRPELQGAGGDNVGFGTLLFAGGTSVNKQKEPVELSAPAGLFAKTNAKAEVNLTWVAPIGTPRFTIKRAIWKTGPFQVIARNIAGNQYTDRQAKGGQLYYYTVSAALESTNSPDAYPISIVAALPAGWRSTIIGSGMNQVYGAADADGFTLESTGLPADSTGEHFYTVYQDKAAAMVIIRYVPQISAQSSAMGITMREGQGKDQPGVSLVLRPESSKITEAPRWTIKISSLSSSSGGNKISTNENSMSIESDTVINRGMITHGRLTGYCWFKLERHGDNFFGFISADGQTWNAVGHAQCALKHYQTGILISSGNATIKTRIRFDHITLK